MIVKKFFFSVWKIEGRLVKFGDNAKVEVIRFGSVKINSSYELTESYLIDELKHNLLSVGHLSDTGHKVSLRGEIFYTNHEKINISFIGDCVDNVYILNNINVSTLTSLTIPTNEPWLWKRKLEHSSMHYIEKHPRLKLVNGLLKSKAWKGSHIWFLQTC